MPRHKIIAAVAVYGVLAGFLVPRFDRTEALASIVWAPGGPGSRPRIGASPIDDLDFAVVRIEHLAVPPFDLVLDEGAHWRNSSARAIAVIILVAMDADGNVLDAAPGPIVWYGKDGTYIQETYPKSLIQSGVGRFKLVRVAMDAVLRSDLKLDDAVHPIPGRSYQGEIEIRWPIPPDGRLSGGEVKVEHGRSGDIAILGAPITVEGNVTGAPISIQDNVTIEDNVIPPKLIEKVNPVYPPDAREAKAEGKIVLEAIIDTDGSVISTKVLRGTEFPSLEQSAIDAVSRWRYKPATDPDGVPVKVDFTVMIEYSSLLEICGRVPTSGQRARPAGHISGIASAPERRPARVHRLERGASGPLGRGSPAEVQRGVMAAGGLGVPSMCVRWRGAGHGALDPARSAVLIAGAPATATPAPATPRHRGRAADHRRLLPHNRPRDSQPRRSLRHRQRHRTRHSHHRPRPSTPNHGHQPPPQHPRQPRSNHHRPQPPHRRQRHRRQPRRRRRRRLLLSSPGPQSRICARRRNRSSLSSRAPG
jgi:protein TonB